MKEGENMSDEKRLEVIWVQPMKEAQVIEMENNLDSMKALVDGYIEEYMPFEDNAAIVCNEEGKILGLPLNRAIYDEDGRLQDVICGSFFICHAPPECEEYESLPEDMKEKYMRKFKEPERFFKTPEGIRAVKLCEKEEKSYSRER